MVQVHVVEQDVVHRDGDGLSEDQVLQPWKEERGKQKSMEIKAKVLIGILFSPIKTQCVIGFRIDSRTIKRGDLMANMVI